mmetsp:Transcript_15549/g.22856  ORF Transcript_15549/g.22856 Transcript_15549/m.22856 type:complete len:222 (+) Transcript_15549:422-1087(+)
MIRCVAGQGTQVAFLSIFSLKMVWMEHIVPHTLHVVSFDGIDIVSKFFEQIFVVLQGSCQDTFTGDSKSSTIGKVESETVVGLVGCIRNNILVVECYRISHILLLLLLLLLRNEWMKIGVPPHGPRNFRIGTWTSFTIGRIQLEHHIQTIGVPNFWVSCCNRLNHVPVFSVGKRFRVVLPEDTRTHVTRLSVVGAESKGRSGGLRKDGPVSKVMVVVNDVV